MNSISQLACPIRGQTVLTDGLLNWFDGFRSPTTHDPVNVYLTTVPTHYGTFQIVCEVCVVWPSENNRGLKERILPKAMKSHGWECQGLWTDSRAQFKAAFSVTKTKRKRRSHFGAMVSSVGLLRKRRLLIQGPYVGLALNLNTFKIGRRKISKNSKHACQVWS